MFSTQFQVSKEKKKSGGLKKEEFEKCFFIYMFTRRCQNYPCCVLEVHVCFLRNNAQKLTKLEMLGSIVSRLASPRTILGENFLSTQDGIKDPEMHKKVKVGKFLEVKKKIG